MPKVFLVDLIFFAKTLGKASILYVLCFIPEPECNSNTIAFGLKKKKKKKKKLTNKTKQEKTNKHKSSHLYNL